MSLFKKTMRERSRKRMNYNRDRTTQLVIDDYTKSFTIGVSIARTKWWTLWFCVWGGKT